MTNQRLDRVFVDTSFFIAAANQRDQFHDVAHGFDTTVQRASEVWTTDAVLLEFAAAFASPSLRAIVAKIWNEFHSGAGRFRTVEASSQNLVEAMTLFRSRSDKFWSLTDCLSFLVMQREGLVDALTTDQHFVQAGFRALLIE